MVMSVNSVNILRMSFKNEGMNPFEGMDLFIFRVFILC